jgi:hypothetical protein
LHVVLALRRTSGLGRFGTFSHQVRRVAPLVHPSHRSDDWNGLAEHLLFACYFASGPIVEHRLQLAMTQTLMHPARVEYDLVLLGHVLPEKGLPGLGARIH